MNSTLIIQSRELKVSDIDWITGLISKNPTWSRYKLSREICTHWDWQNGKGQMKDIACRSLLSKVLGKIKLSQNRGIWNRNIAKILL